MYNFMVKNVEIYQLFSDIYIVMLIKVHVLFTGIVSCFICIVV